MDIMVVLLGIAAQVFAQRRLARARADTWVAMGVPFAILVPLTLLTGVVNVEGEPRLFALGAAVGSMLHVATQLFFAVVRPWRAFTDDVHQLYLE